MPKPVRANGGRFSAVLIVQVALILALSAMIALNIRGSDSSELRPKPLADVPVTATNLSDLRAHNSPMLAVDPTERRFVALASRVDGPFQFECVLHLSGDAGRTWQPANPVPDLPPPGDRCYAPETTFDRSGNLYYLFVGLRSPGNRPTGAFLTTSSDRGRSFGPPREVIGPGRFMVRMAVDSRGRVHLAWVEPGTEPPTGGFADAPNRILAARSDDGGKTFSSPVQVNDPSRMRVVAPALLVGPADSVNVAYYDLGDDARDYRGLEGPTWEGEWSLLLAGSDNGGRSFSRHASISSEIVPHERVMLIFTTPPPTMAAGPDGHLYTAWTDARHGDADVLFARSGDGGRSWEGPLRLNDDDMGSGREQYLPQLAVAPGGRVVAIFYDRRDDPEGLRMNAYFTASEDRGRRFGPNIRLSSEGFFWQSGVSYGVPSARGLVEFGSRLGLSAGPSQALAAWTDTRMTRRGSSPQDIFATTVVLPQTENSSWAQWIRLAAFTTLGTLPATALVLVRGRRRHSAGRTGDLS